MDLYCEESQGQRRWWKEVEFPFTDLSGETMIGGLAFNVTELKQAEEELTKAFNDIKELKDRLERENIYLQEDVDLQHKYGEIIGKSDAIQHVLHQAEQVADTDTTVLISGETGTGKELLAQAIPKMSSRRNRTLVMVNCAALPPTLYSRMKKLGIKRNG